MFTQMPIIVNKITKAKQPAREALAAARRYATVPHAGWTLELDRDEPGFFPTMVLAFSISAISAFLVRKLW